jgi:hypothetical protein
MAKTTAAMARKSSGTARWWPEINGAAVEGCVKVYSPLGRVVLIARLTVAAACKAGFGAKQPS